mmetsp:Transcript_12845/g.22162  ORF Transcript_12845/g.22162 Transcript_12845/m.22162 type:complete len:210 (+) Transcript_12845:218-847(+)
MGSRLRLGGLSNGGYFLPLAIEGLLPEGDGAIPTGYGQDVANEGPAKPPYGGVEAGEGVLLPVGLHLVRLLPDQHRVVLRAGRDGGVGEADRWRPGDVSHPVGVAVQRLFQHPPVLTLDEPPYLDHVVAAAGDKTLDRGRGESLGVGEGARWHRRSPGDGVAADVVRLELVHVPRVVVLESDDGDGAVRRGAGQREAELLGREGDPVYG